jgi:hypothetical protein
MACNNSATDNKSVSTPLDTIKTFSEDSLNMDKGGVPPNKVETEMLYVSLHKN